MSVIGKVKIWVKKYAFITYELEYLGSYISHKSIKPIFKKVQAVLNIQMLKTTK